MVDTQNCKAPEDKLNVAQNGFTLKLVEFPETNNGQTARITYDYSFQSANSVEVYAYDPNTNDNSESNASATAIFMYKKNGSDSEYLRVYWPQMTVSIIDVKDKNNTFGGKWQKQFNDLGLALSCRVFDNKDLTMDKMDRGDKNGPPRIIISGYSDPNTHNVIRPTMRFELKHFIPNTDDRGGSSHIFYFMYEKSLIKTEEKTQSRYKHYAIRLVMPELGGKVTLTVVHIGDLRNPGDDSQLGIRGNPLGGAFGWDSLNIADDLLYNHLVKRIYNKRSDDDKNCEKAANQVNPANKPSDSAEPMWKDFANTPPLACLNINGTTVDTKKTAEKGWLAFWGVSANQSSSGDPTGADEGKNCGGVGFSLDPRIFILRSFCGLALLLEDAATELMEWAMDLLKGVIGLKNY